MHYFTHIPWIYTCHNKLYKEIRQLLEDNDRVILTDNDIKEFKKGILDKIDGLNATNFRCKPIKAHWEEEGTSDSKLYLGAGTICQYHIYATKE